VKNSPFTDYIEVFVYPVRAGQWLDKKSVLKKEIENVRKDMELFNKENALETLAPSDNTFTDFTSSDSTINVVTYDNHIMDGLSNEFDFQTYLMFLQDKFLRVRHTVIKDAVSNAEVERAV